MPRRLVHLSPVARRVCTSRVVASQSGAAVLEFALIALPLIALLMAILETALISFSKQAIETSTETAARIIMTGQAQSTGMTRQQFHDAACTTLPSYLSCSKLMVDVEQASNFSAVNLSPPALTYDGNGNVTNTFAYDTGSSSTIVIVRLMYLWPVSTSGLGLALANAGHGNHLLIATNVAKTEPYS